MTSKATPVTTVTTPSPSYWGSPEADAAAERICDRREISEVTAILVTVQLPTDPTYWGSTKYEADPDNLLGILDRMESMIRSEFGDRFDLEFERTQTPQGSGVHSSDDAAAAAVHEWLENNWTAA